MRHRQPPFLRFAAAALLSGGLLATAAQAQGTADGPTARAELNDSKGNRVGTATFTQYAQGVLIRTEVENLPPGTSAIHIHEVGRCDPPSFESAGDHYNPGNHQHGFGAEGHHAGDLPNLHIGSDGRAVAEFFSKSISLRDRSEQQASGSTLEQAQSLVRSMMGDASNNILSGDGTSLVIHANADDYRTNPAGNAGERIACGVIR